MTERVRRLTSGVATVIVLVAGLYLSGRISGFIGTPAISGDVALTSIATAAPGDGQLDPFSAGAVSWQSYLQAQGVDREISAAHAALWDRDYAEAVSIYHRALEHAGADAELSLFLHASLVTAFAQGDDREAAQETARTTLPVALQVATGEAIAQQPLLMVSCLLIVSPLVLWKNDLSAEELTIAAEVAARTSLRARELRHSVEAWAQAHSAPTTGHTFDTLDDWAGRGDVLGARAAARLGRCDGATGALRKVAKEATCNTTLGLALYCLGGTLVDMGSKDEAATALAQALVPLEAVIGEYGQRCPREFVWLHEDTERLLADLDPARRVAWFCRLWLEDRLGEMPEFGIGSSPAQGSFLAAAQQAAAADDIAGLIRFGEPARVARDTDDNAKVSIELSFGRDTPPLLVTGDTLFSLSRTEGGWRIVDAAPAGMGAEQ